jgi:hypothetical protein
MLSVSMTVLKVIGIMIGSLLGLLLVVVLLILFLPVRYRGDGHRNQKGMGLQVKLRWMFGLVRVNYSYPKPGNWVVKLLFFTVYKSGGGTSPGQEKPSNNKKKIDKSNNGKKSNHIKNVTENTDDDQLKYEPLETDRDKPSAPPFSNQDSISHSQSLSGHVYDADTIKPPNQGQETDTQEPPLQKKKSLWHRFLAFLYKWLAFLQQKLSDGTYYLNLLRAEETVQVFRRTKERLHKVLHSLRPRKLAANIEFGTGAPDTTGLAYGACSMLYPYLGKYINITPNFEQAMLQGDISLSGWAVGWVIIASVLRISFDKGIRLFLKKWKREVA